MHTIGRSFTRLAAPLALLVVTVGLVGPLSACSGGEGEDCITDGDCDQPLSCVTESYNYNTNTTHKSCQCVRDLRGAECSANGDGCEVGSYCQDDCTCSEVPSYCGDGVLDGDEECESDADCGGYPCYMPATVGPDSCMCLSDLCAGTRQYLSWLTQATGFTVLELALGNMQIASDGVSQAAAEGNTDQRCLAYGVVDAAELDSVYSSCQLVGMECQYGSGDLDGPIAIIVMDLADVVPEGDAVWSYQYGVVFRTDSDSSNDWTGISAYPNDVFIGTDRWVQFTKTAGYGWGLDMDDITSTQEVVEHYVPTLRVFRDETRLVFFIPLSELGTSPSFRITAFRHDGTWLDGQWNIDYYPLVQDPLIPLE